MKSAGKIKPIALIRLNSMCIFCKIIAHDIPCHQVYEDDKVLAFLDIKPVNPGHILVMPKKHYQNIDDINEEDFIAVMLVVKKMG